MESELFELSRSYPGEYRHCEQHIFGRFLESGEIKIDGAEVDVTSQVHGGML
jgi:hypothetical protein